MLKVASCFDIAALILLLACTGLYGDILAERQTDRRIDTYTQTNTHTDRLIIILCNRSRGRSINNSF